MKRSETYLAAKLTLILIMLFSLSTAALAAGKLDPTFGTGGSVTINPGTGTKTIDIAIQTDGKILVAGYFGPESNTAIFVTRLNADGSLDSGYGSGGTAVMSLPFSQQLTDIELQADGKLVAVGYTNPGPIDHLILRLNTDGSLDQTFNGTGFRTIDQFSVDVFNKLTIQPDGKIIAVGQSYHNFMEFSRLAVTMRFTVLGDFDRTFNRTGIANYSYSFAWDPGMGYYPLSDVEVLNDGRIMTLGHYSTAGDSGYFIQMLTPNGSIDNTFGVPKYYVRDYQVAGTDGPFAPDAEVLTDGSVAIVSRMGIRVTDFNTFDKTFPQFGGQITALPDGKFVTASWAGARVFSRQNFISSAWNLGASRIARQTDGKLVFLNGSLVKRGTVIGSQGNRLANFGLDHRSDPTIFRPSERNLYVGGETFFIRPIGYDLIKVFPEYGVLHDSAQQRMWREVTVGWGNAPNNTPGSPVYLTFNASSHAPAQWGVVGDIPYSGDFNGDGLMDVGVFRPSTGMWWGYNDAQFIGPLNPSVQWGETGDKPVPADYDFDGVTDFAVYRPSNGTWWVRRSSDGGYFVANFGLSTDIPLTGDFDGDGYADFTVYRPNEGAWYQFTTTEGFKYNVFGLPTDIPVPGDYDGDGRFDIAVFRDGVWHILQSGSGYRTISWGVTSDLLVTTRHDQP